MMLNPKKLFCGVFIAFLSSSALQLQASVTNDALDIGLELLAIQADVEDLRAVHLDAAGASVPPVVRARAAANYTRLTSMIDDALDDLNDAFMGWYFATDAVGRARGHAQILAVGNRIGEILDQYDIYESSVESLL